MLLSIITLYVILKIPQAQREFYSTYTRFALVRIGEQWIHLRGRIMSTTGVSFNELKSGIEVYEKMFYWTNKICRILATPLTHRSSVRFHKLHHEYTLILFFFCVWIPYPISVYILLALCLTITLQYLLFNSTVIIILNTISHAMLRHLWYFTGATRYRNRALKMVFPHNKTGVSTLLQK